MNRLALLLGVFLGVGALAGCKEDVAGVPPPPHELTSAAIGYYCGMNLMEHGGPKGQIILASRSDPIWFSSARDAVSFTLLPEEPKDIRAIYVSDMAKAPSWDDPGTKNWVDARKGFFVIGSRVAGGWVHLKPSRFQIGRRPTSSLPKRAGRSSLLMPFRATTF